MPTFENRESLYSVREKINNAISSLEDLSSTSLVAAQEAAQQSQNFANSSQASAAIAAQEADEAASIVGGLGSLTAAVSSAQTAQLGAETARSGAETAKTSAETARDLAVAASSATGAYASVSVGLAATTNGQRFWAPSGEYLQLYTNNAGTAVAVANVIMPLKSYFDSRFADNVDPWVVESSDGFIIMRATSDATVRINWPVRLGASVLSETSGQLRLGSLYLADAPSVSGIQFVTEDSFVLFNSTNMYNTISME